MTEPKYSSEDKPKLYFPDECFPVCRSLRYL